MSGRHRHRRAGTPARAARTAVRSAADFVEGGGFAIFILSVVTSLWLATVALLAVPGADGGLGAFADDFRRWCFGWRDDGPDVAWLVAMLTSPVFLVGLTLLIWWQPLRELRHARRRAWVAPALVAVALSSASMLGLVFTGAPAADPTVFPARGLRTAVPAPAFELVDHEGRDVSLASLRGRVVVLTSIYARCHATCPMILAQAEEAVAALSPGERADLTVVAVTLDPEHDDVERLSDLAEARGLTAPTWRLATGAPDTVERTLDLMGVARTRDPETGLIDHANVFLLVDRQGRVAYRFTLGELQADWMGQALRLLLDEAVPEA